MVHIDGDAVACSKVLWALVFEGAPSGNPDPSHASCSTVFFGALLVFNPVHLFCPRIIAQLFLLTGCLHAPFWSRRGRNTCNFSFLVSDCSAALFSQTWIRIRPTFFFHRKSGCRLLGTSLQMSPPGTMPAKPPSFTYLEGLSDRDAILANRIRPSV